MAKSPTPIPAPPVKIQRDTNGAAPAAPAAKPKKAAPKKRRKRRRNPLLWFLHGLIRRIYFGLKTASRLVLLVPILVFMVAFSYNVDRSGLFQGALAPRRIVDLMLQGYDVTNFEQMDERQVVQLFAQDVEQALRDSGLTGQDFAAFVKTPRKDGSADYGLRYEELITLCIRQIQRLQTRVRKLEETA